MKAYQKIDVEAGRVLSVFVDGDQGTVASIDPDTGHTITIAMLEGDVMRQARRLYGDGFEEVSASEPHHVASRVNPYDDRTFKTARRRLTMQEKIALINEDMSDPDDVQI